MSMLIKPYTIAVYKDVSSDSGFGFSEQRLGIIGSDTMDYQGKVLQPELTRNVNGKNRLTFKMYRRFVDTVTGEKVTNPFVDWLVSEAKVKLNYEDKWYDFIVKHISENSSTYLCTYQLEDALAQELSKNGFGVILDARLMNNIGNSQELGNYVMAETDWTVEADTIVETVEEPLVYITIPAGISVTHVLDQSSDDEGVTTEEMTLTEDITALAFYSCCKNKPHRFQFIYSNKLDSPVEVNTIQKNDDRVIEEPDCQYYIDIDGVTKKYGNEQSDLKIFLPEGIQPYTPGAIDTRLSSLYRGKRYGFAQQSVYVPLLDKYCSRFIKTDSTIDSDLIMHGEGSSLDNYGISEVQGVYTKNKSYTGLKIMPEDGYINGNTYKISYVLGITGGTLKNIGGHKQSFLSNMDIYECEYSGGTYVKKNKIASTQEDHYTFTPARGSGTYLIIEANYLKIKNDTDYTPYLFIQPNRGLADSISFTISGFTLKTGGEYLSYIDTEYVSPTLIQNYINNYNFDSTAGWTMTSSYRTSLQEPSSVVNCYGRFKETSGGKISFVSMLDDFLSGEYSTEHEYKAYMKLTFTDKDQFVLNSGLRDNRTIIGNLSVGQELALNLKILNDSGIETNVLTPSIGEYVYSSSNSCYNARTDFITIEKQDNFDGKQIYKVTSSNYTKDTFKENSRLYLKIAAPTNFVIDSNNDGKNVPKIFYIETASLYKKVVADGKIIEPDYDSENSVAADAFTNGILKKTYNYFPRWLIDEGVITDQESLPLVVSDTLSYSEFVPIYNTGAEKIRTVTASESNYFNIIQSIAETFGQWPELEITRNADGSIQTNGKKIRFKNYQGVENHAGFRYGVNLKDITRDYASNNIVTKLLVKQNSNEHAENGVCTIQRAGANPTGENYLYDFSYYQNVGLMDAEDFLTENYYINYDDAKGPDMGLWEGQTATDDITLNGYYLRVKKLNDVLAPINEQISGKKIDLIQYQSEEKVAKATYDAALSGIEQTKEDFKALVGVYPNEIQQDKIKTVTVTSALPQESWYVIDPAEPTVEDDNITVSVKTIAKDLQTYPIPQLSGLTRHQTVSNYVYKISTSDPWDGIYLDFEYNTGRNYVLEYDITLNETAIVDKTSTLVNIGCHNDNTFEQSTDDKYKDLPFIKVTRVSNNKSVSCDFESNIVDIGGLLNDGETELPKGGNSLLHVVIQGVYRPSESATRSYFWIQPNRGVATPVTCTISNIKMFERGSVSNTSGSNRKAYVDLTVQITTDENIQAPLRKYTLEVPIMAGSETGSAVQTVAIVDTNRTDIKKYLEEYTTYTEKLNSSTADKTRLSGNISTIKNEIASLETCQKNYLEWKQKLNQTFFKKYSRFIQEGTWLDEEYVDDDKYYVDAQSVLYNSCHPQAAYTISVLELSQLPGYEQFKFNLGDTTWAIDEEFFGNDKKMEVTITEKINRLDDPTQNKIKVQTSKEQFKDLFQRITAAVQQAQYSAGDYKKGSALMDANKQKQSEFITDALNSAASFLAPGKSHTVTWEGGDGITVTDDTTPTNQVKIVGGAILLSAEHPETKEQTWITGVTNKGVSASLITAGKLNTGEVQIMSGDEPVFRWDAYGISAYDAVWGQDGDLSTISGINSKKFVRFDKNGIYGMNAAGIDGASWHPNSVSDVENNASFYLTWDGMQVIPGNLTYTNSGSISASPNDFRLKMGRVDDYIFNKWNTNGLPSYVANSEEPKFVKVFSVGDFADVGSTSEKLVIYSDGTLVAEKIKLPGSVEWTEASSPSKNVYASSALNKPENGKKYSSFDDSGDTVWHKIWDSEKDTHYCHTDNGGATWEGPFLLTGRSIQSTEVQYAVAEVGLSNDDLSEETTEQAVVYNLRSTPRASSISWYENIADAGTPKAGQCLYTRIRDNYNDGESSAWRFFAGTTPTSDLTLSATSLVVQEDQNGKLTPDTVALTAAAENLPSSSWDWSGVTSSSNTATFYTADMLDSDSKTITVTYGDYSDSVTIVKVKEGSDAVSYVLSNPTMVFNKADTDAVETCSIIVYRGATSIPYGAATEYSNGWYYTLAENDDKVVINGNGAITVTNPGATQNISINLTLYKGSEDATETKELNVGCTVLSNLKISLTNDSGVVVTDADGNNGGYGPNTTTTAKVYEGSTDVSSDWTFSASLSHSGATFEQIEDDEGKKTNTFKVTNLGSNDSAVLTITATKGGDTLTTDFVVSKLKQGGSGSDAISCYIDSSKGNLLLDTDSGTVTLTARIFIGQQEFDKYENLQYNWYVEGESDPINENSGSGATDFNERTITLNAEYVKNKTFYFTATEKQS